MPWPTRWLIGVRHHSLTERLFLHVFDDGEADAEMDFLADQARALRFATAECALRFAREHGLTRANAVEYDVAADEVAPLLHPLDSSAVT